MTRSPVSLSREGAVSVITIDDGKANAFSPLVLSEFNRVLDDISTEDGAVVIAGRPGVFSGGFDLKIMTSGDMNVILKLLTDGGNSALRLLTFPRPVVMAVTGHAIAMGALMTLAGDWRVGAGGESKIGLNEVRNFMPLPLFGVELCKQRLNPLVLVQATMHSRIFVGEETAMAGFVDEVISADAVLSTAMERAEDLASLTNPPYRQTKQFLFGPLIERLRAALAPDTVGSFD